MTAEDIVIVIVAPCNAWVNALAGALPDVRVGTVDRFQRMPSSDDRIA